MEASLPGWAPSGAELMVGGSSTDQVISMDESLHIVHVIQRERGRTCGWVASSGAGTWCERVFESRQTTDEAIEKAAKPLDADVEERLREVRSTADAAVASDPPPNAIALAFYAAFSRYNSLIKEVIDRSTNAFHAGEFEIYMAFTRLKEATGIERAFLCGALALPDESIAHLPSRAFADLVIGLQEQRRYKAVVKEAAPPMLLELIRAGFEYSPALLELQNRLYDDFDVTTLRRLMSAEQVAGLLVACRLPPDGLLLASCWPPAGLLLAS